jgi:hypothetical protein
MLNDVTLVERAGDRVSASEVTVTHVSRRDQWEHLLAQVSFAHFTQVWCYGEGKHAQGWSTERLVFQDQTGPVAACQVLVKTVLGLALVARINRGPLFLQSASAEQQLAVFTALRCRWRFARRGFLLIAPALPPDEASSTLLRAAGFRQRRAGGWGSSLIDLDPPLDAIRASFSSKWRNPLNGAIRAGMEVRMRSDAEAFEWMLERHVSNMAIKGFVGPEPDFVRSMVAASPEIFWVLQAIHGNEPVSGLMGVCLSSRAENYLGWTNDEGRRTGAHNLLLWNAVVEMKAAGCHSLDLGGFTTSGKYGAYKRGMKGREYRLCGEWLGL